MAWILSTEPACSVEAAATNRNNFIMLMPKARTLACEARTLALNIGAKIALLQHMMPSNLIAIRHITTAGRRIPVMLSRNASGSVAGRVILADDDAPILDGPDIDSVLRMIQAQLEWLLLARSRRSA